MSLVAYAKKLGSKTKLTVPFGAARGQQHITHICYLPPPSKYLAFAIISPSLSLSLSICMYIYIYIYI